jgi:hypothetical protein
MFDQGGRGESCLEYHVSNIKFKIGFDQTASIKGALIYAHLGPNTIKEPWAIKPES